jgi:hypothetical protein
MGQILAKSLHNKYGLKVLVSEPIKDKQNVDTWKVAIETRVGSKHLPAQRINLDICALPPYEKRPMLLLNPYGVDMGTSGLIMQAQSREEIYADKLIVFAFRPNRIKYRDLWDILWLHSQGLRPKLELIPNKLKDRHHTMEQFLNSFGERLQSLKEKPELAIEFKQEMARFLPAEQAKKVLEQEGLWGSIIYLIEDLGKQIANTNGRV